MLAEGQREHDDVGALRGVLSGRRHGARSEHLDRERDLRRIARPGDEDVVPGRDGEPGEDGPDLAGAEDAEDPDRCRHALAPSTAPSPANSSRTRGITSVP